MFIPGKVLLKYDLQSPLKIPYVYIFMKQFIFLKYSFYANLTTRALLKQIAQFDSSEYYFHSTKYERNTNGNGSGSTYITMKQRLLKYSLKTTYILCLKNTICISKLNNAR